VFASLRTTNRDFNQKEDIFTDSPDRLLMVLLENIEESSDFRVPSTGQTERQVMFIYMDTEVVRSADHGQK